MVESSLNIPQIDELRLYIYRRPLHPELFNTFLDKSLSTDSYQADLWVFGLGHLVCFHTTESTITELLAPQDDLYSDKELVKKLPVDTHRECQFSLNAPIHYVINTSLEAMSEPVFERVHGEMIRFGQKCGLLMTFDQWAEPDGLVPFSLIDYEYRKTELNVFTYHAFPKRRLMLKTQSVFSLNVVTNPFAPDRGKFGKDSE